MLLFASVVDFYVLVKEHSFFKSGCDATGIADSDSVVFSYFSLYIVFGNSLQVLFGDNFLEERWRCFIVILELLPQTHFFSLPYSTDQLDVIKVVQELVV